MPDNPRDLEWERRYREKDTPWDKGQAAPALVNFLREGRISGRVLVPGCGHGHDVQALGAHEDIAAVGLDLSETAIVQAKARMLQDDRTANISFIAGDFFHLPAKLRRSFDWLVEHTCFCAIDPASRPDYVRAAATALRTGGRIFGIFFLTPDVESGPPFVVSREELSELFDPHFSLLEEWTPRESFPGREGRELIRVLHKK
jgi:SAM-dependent methyltransferase